MPPEIDFWEMVTKTSSLALVFACLGIVWLSKQLDEKEKKNESLHSEIKHLTERSILLMEQTKQVVSGSTQVMQQVVQRLERVENRIDRA